MTSNTPASTSADPPGVPPAAQGSTANSEATPASGAASHGHATHAGASVIVTGGSRGIGRVIAERFLAAGAQVTICGRTAPELPVTSDGQTAHFVAADVRQHDDIDSVVSAVLERTGRLDVLINNAGGSPHVMTADASPRFIASIIALNLTSAIIFAQRANAVMQGQETGGTILNISSVSAMRPSPGTAPYGAAKAGLNNATQSLAVEWAPKVRINAISAGLIATEHAADHYGGQAGFDAVAKTVPLGRFGTPDDIASACLFLTSPAASYITGANLVINGGDQWPAFLTAAAAFTSG